MNIFSPFGLQRKSIEIAGGGVLLRTPVIEDYDQWKTLRQKSRAFLTPWEPAWHDEELTRPAFRYRLRHYQKCVDDDLGQSFFIFTSGGATLLGGINLSNLRRGVAQCATLGYWIGEPYARQGHMTRAVQALKPYAFTQLRLHRIEAACLPHNTASVRLLERTGFAREGLAPSYLKINGAWEDHILWACREAL